MKLNLQQHSIQFPYWYANGIPNHPNYFLGCDTLLGCACLTDLPHSPLSAEGGTMRAAPNPNNGNFTLQFNVVGISGELKIYDVMGNVVWRDYVAPWSQFKKIDISNMASGIYFGKMQWENTVASVKIVKE